MAKKKSIQSGLKSFSGTSDTVTITAVVMANSFVEISVRGDLATGANTGSECNVSAELTSTTQITLSRNASGGTVEVEWQVIEFASGVTVQRGSQGTFGTSTNITITAVTLANSWPILTTECDAGGSMGSHDVVVAELTSTTNLQLRKDAAGGFQNGEWQVVEYDNCSVQAVTDTPTGTSDNTTITSVTLAKTISFGTSERAENGSVQGREIWRFKLTTSTNIAWSRDFNIGAPYTWVVYVVDITDDVTVQRGDMDITTSNTTDTATITAVTADDASVHLTLQSGYWATFNSANTIQLQREWCTVTFNSTTEIEAERGEGDGGGGETTHVHFEVIEWEPDPGAGGGSIYKQFFIQPEMQ